MWISDELILFPETLAIAVLKSFWTLEAAKLAFVMPLRTVVAEIVVTLIGELPQTV